MKHLQKYEPTTGRHYAEPMDSLEVHKEVYLPVSSLSTVTEMCIIDGNPRYYKPTFKYMTKREDKL